MKTREICHGEAVRKIVENCNSTRESIHAGEATAKKTRRWPYALDTVFEQRPVLTN